MKGLWRFLFGRTESQYAWLIRLSVGLIFATQGYLKFADPKMGVIRFTKIGFAHPAFTAHFVGTFEMICGILVLLGLWVRLACMPLLIVNLMAILTTKIPELSRPGQGFWFVVSDARTDFAMLTGILFLLAVGSGRLSVQKFLRGGADAREPATGT